MNINIYTPPTPLYKSKSPLRGCEVQFFDLASLMFVFRRGQLHSLPC